MNHSRSLYYLLLALIIPYVISAKIHEAPESNLLPVSGLSIEGRNKTVKKQDVPVRMRKKVIDGAQGDADHNEEVGEESAIAGDVMPGGIAGSKEFEEMRKNRRMIIDLVKQGKKFFQDNTLDVACNTFIKTKQFIRGEVYIFVFDTDGFCYAQGDNTDNLWQDFTQQKDEYGGVFVVDFIKKARAGGGWVSYRYHNTSKVSYVELVEKDGKQYVIGAGYYPHSKVYACMNLVKGAVSYFYEAQAVNAKEDEIFSTMSYSIGRFVSGDLYLYVLDEKGTLIVQGDLPSLVGSNVYYYKDAKGTYTNQEIINRLNKTSTGIWVEYMSKGAPKRVYAEKVTSKAGKNYYIACGYYPDTTREKVVEMVAEGYRHMKKGKDDAFKDFANRNNYTFHYGDLYLVIYNMKGACVAHGASPEFIGREYLDEKDEAGIFYMKSMIELANKAGKGWVNIKLKNAYEALYLEKINLGLEDYIITCSMYPISKREAMELLVKDAVQCIKISPEMKYAFRDLVNPTGRFSFGDLEIFVFEEDGICAVYGGDTDRIWKNMMNAKDQDGRPYVKLFINAARRTPARVVYKKNNATALAYIERVEKDGFNLYVGSSFYTYDNIHPDERVTATH